jgi:hypothetical protein
MTRGFLYTAFGERYLQEARISARSVKRHHPDTLVCLVTDLHLEPDGEFDVIQPITPASDSEIFAPLDTGAYYRKIEQFGRSPFDLTVYLDSDTFVTAPLDGLFDLLLRFDLLVTLDGNAEVNYAFEQTDEPFTRIPKAFGCFNAGVLAYRKSPQTLDFFQQWSRNYQQHVQRHTVNDQPAFRLTLFESSLRYHILPVTFNWFSWIPYFIPSGGRIMIMHGRNPWLFQWASHLDAPTATVVGRSPLKHRAIVFAARVLHWLSRRRLLPKPRL